MSQISYFDFKEVPEVHKYKIEEIESIEFFPDYCSDGIWLTLKPNPRGCHGSASFDILPWDFPQWFKNKVKALQFIYDMFADSGDHESKYEFTFDENDLFLFKCVKIIEADFKKLYPEDAHLLFEYSIEDKGHL